MPKHTAETNRLRIAHVVQNMYIGGLEKLVFELIERSDAERFAPELICLGDGGTLFEELKGRGFRVAAMNKGDGIDFLLIMKMARKLRRDRIDIVHCHNWNPLVYGGIGGRLAGCRGIVYTAHGPEIPSVRRQRILQRLPIADRIVTISDYVRHSAITKAGFSPSAVTTIVNGIDVERYETSGHRLQVRSELGVTPDTAVFGVVARLSGEKDHRTLLDAFQGLVASHAGVVLIIVGDGDLRDGLEAQADAIGIGNHVRFMGSRDDVPRLLSAFDVFVLPSREEGLGIAILEAMAAGLPVVATKTGGIPEVVEDGQTGLVVAPGERVLLAKALEWMLAHRSEARAMGEAGKQRVTREFTIGRTMDCYVNVYEELAGRGKKNGADR